MQFNDVVGLLVVLSIICFAFLPSCTSHNAQVLHALPSPVLSSEEALAERSRRSRFMESRKAERFRDYSLEGTSADLLPSKWYPENSERNWQAIIVHHSATSCGGARAFDKAHRAKGWDELGYDFVIGNGTDTPDGCVETGSRWLKQKWGAHCKTPTNFYNNHGIGICLVGNFDCQRPSAGQLASLKKLMRFLARRYHITSDRVLGYGEVKGAHTRCPGANMPLGSIRGYVADCL